MRFQTGITEQMESLLVENGIDVHRVTAAKVELASASGATEITVTLLAVNQDDEAAT